MCLVVGRGWWGFLSLRDPTTRWSGHPGLGAGERGKPHGFRYGLRCGGRVGFWFAVEFRDEVTAIGDVFGGWARMV
jgi:hypothetical protein